MGWLRQAWQRTGCRSANEVAELLLAHDRVPSSLEIKPVSLANNLRALDRGKRLGWWRRHRSLLGPLASVLERAPDELEQLLADPAPEDGARDGALDRIALAPFGCLRPLDPSEALPPGFPELVSRPGRWRRVWWTTLDRRARRIAGQWLEARGLARYLTATSLADALAKVPVEGRVFLELTTRVDAADYVAFADALELDCLRVCVAAPFHWRSTWIPAPGAAFVFSEREDSGPWTDVDATEISSAIEPLLNWVTDRIPRVRRPARDNLAALVRSLDPASGFSGPGDVLDFVGLWSATTQRARPAVGARRAWARHRLVIAFASSDESSPTSTKATDDVVCALLAKSIQGSPAAWLYGQTYQSWTNQLPTEFAVTHDSQSIRELLEGADDGLSSEKVNQLREALSSSPNVVLDRLVQAGVFVPVADDCLSLDPSWAANILYSDALDHLLEGDAREVGRLALHAPVVDAVIERLLAHFVRGDLRHAQRLLRDARRTTSNARTLATYEVCVCALGLARLIQPEFPPELLELARSALAQTLCVVDELPHGLAVPLVGDHASLCTLAVYTLAALSLDAVWDDELKPGNELSNVRELCAVAAHALSRLQGLEHGSRLLHGAFRLGAKLVRHATRIIGEFDELRLPGLLYVLAAEWRRDDVITRMFRKHYVTVALLREPDLRPRLILEGLSVVGPEMDGAPGALLDTLWDMWTCGDVEFARRTAPPIRWLDIDEDATERVWRRGSTEHKLPFMSLLLEDERFPSPVARALSETDWDAWVELVLARADADAPGTADAWKHVPPVIAIKIAADSRLDDLRHDAIITGLWTVIPARLLQEARSGALGQAVKSFVGAPECSLSELLSITASRLKSAEEIDNESRVRFARWLHSIVLERGTGWRQALKLRRSCQPGWQGLTAAKVLTRDR